MLMNACGSLTEPGPDICRHYDDIMPGLLIRIMHERMDVRQRFR